MVQLRRVLPGILALVVASVARAQSIRGTVVAGESRLPVPSVLVTMLDENGVESGPGVRTDSLGNFIVHARHAGAWRVRAVRIGYSAATSELLNLPVGGLAVVRLPMTQTAQQLLPVQVIEQRNLSAEELMSVVGFDLRQRRGLGTYLTEERLSSMGRDGLREILATQLQPTLFVYSDSVLGDVLRIRQGGRICEPEVFLDGRLLSTAPTLGAIVDGPKPQTLLDSIRARMRVESEQQRVGFPQVYALTLLSSYSANALHGIEVYTANEVPPASLGGWFGMTKSSIRSCGTVAVWTKAGALSVVAARAKITPSRALQVITGTLVDYSTGAPLAGRPVSLLNGSRDRIGAPVTTDEEGEFSFRTPRAGEMRLRAGGNEYLVSTTPSFPVGTNEMVVVKLFVSSHGGLIAPLGIAARIQPQSIGVTSLAGFTYRRERAQGGAFFDGGDIARLGAQTISQVVASVPGVTVRDTSGDRAIQVGGNRDQPACEPALYADGVLLANAMALEALSIERVFGVEVYTSFAQTPSIFAGSGSCGAIVVWSRP